MDNIRLEPYAVRLRINRLNDDSEALFDTAIPFLTQCLARRCMREEGAVIGHIKGFARGPEGSWLRVSVADGRRPVEAEGHLAGCPAHVDVTLNAHVLGLAAERIQELLIDSIDDLTGAVAVTAVLKNAAGDACAKKRSCPG